MTDQALAASRLHRFESYAQDMQDRAGLLDSVLNAMEALDNDGTCPDGVSALIRVSRELSNEIYRSLDCVNLPGSASNG